MAFHLEWFTFLRIIFYICTSKSFVNRFVDEPYFLKNHGWMNNLITMRTPCCKVLMIVNEESLFWTAWLIVHECKWNLLFVSSKCWDHVTVDASTPDFTGWEPWDWIDVQELPFSCSLTSKKTFSSFTIINTLQ